MKKAISTLFTLSLILILLAGCAKNGLPKDDDPTPSKDNKATLQVADEILSSLDELPKTQSSQVDVSDTDLLIP
jgi:predicted small lipoprotein YifL